ncbi:6-carboxytetrahydropterin synthase QueD [Alicyclobacillus tolerans]|uniref:6-carboxytetrahydropterin synthase QueD n=1 Tax=Alicyclobacillus tolerans TaxID=90970 RepID=UPI003B7EB85D
MTHYHLPPKIQTLHEDIFPEQLRYHQRRVSIEKHFTFDAAHHLHEYMGKCHNLHGHTYLLQIEISGIPDPRGIVMDFAELKELFANRIKNRLDHQYLNEVLPPMNTTAENMIVWIWEELEDALNVQFGDRGLRLESLVLYETPTSCAKLRREWMINE